MAVNAGGKPTGEASKPVYNRQQKGHSLILHILLCCIVVGFFTIPYYTISPNHYWHA